MPAVARGAEPHYSSLSSFYRKLDNRMTISKRSGPAAARCESDPARAYAVFIPWWRNRPRAKEGTPMALVELECVFERLSASPIQTFEKGELALAEGTKTGRLLFLIGGTVDVVKDGWHIARVDKPDAVFGDMAVLREKPHSADILVFQTSSFFVVNDALSFLGTEPLIALYIAGVQSERLDAANRSLIAARSRFAVWVRGIGHS
jgi:hypothetical protein